MDHPEDIYVSTSEFKAHLRRYKKLAKTCVVHVTEHGHAAYVFLSLEVFEARKAERIHQAKWQVWAESACSQAQLSDNHWPEELRNEPLVDPSWNLPESLIQPQADIEYLGQPWDNHVARSFDDDVRRRELSDEDLAIVRQCLGWLSHDPHAGRMIDVGPEAHLPYGTRAHRLPAGVYDIIYTLDEDEEVRVCGLIPSL